MSDVPPPPPPFLPPPARREAGGPIPAAPPTYSGVQPQYSYVSMPPEPPPSRSGKALAGFILGLVSVVLFITVLVPILAIVFGLIGAREVKRSEGRRTGLALARIGWMLGVLGLLAGIATWIAVGQEVAGTKNVFDLDVGDCVERPDIDDDEVARLEIFDCDEPHGAEVFAVGELDETDEYPGEEAVQELTSAGCTSEFEGYVGSDPATSELQIFHIYPAESSWDDERSYVCLAVLGTGNQLTDSIEDSGR